MKTEKLEQIILDEIEKVMNAIPANKSDNLMQFSVECKKNLVDFLYVVDALEDRLKIPVGKSIARRSYSVMTVQGLAEALLEDYGEIQVM